MIIMSDYWKKIRQRFPLWAIVACLLLVVMVVVFILRAGYFKGNWVWLIILLCPLMHVFMMKNGCHNHKSDGSKTRTHDGCGGTRAETAASDKRDAAQIDKK